MATEQVVYKPDGGAIGDPERIAKLKAQHTGDPEILPSVASILL